MPPRPPRLVFLLNSAQRRLQQWIATQQTGASDAQAVTPTPAQAGLLFALAQEDGLAMGRIAQLLDLAPSAVSGLVQRCEAFGWVLRQASAADGRGQQVWLQPEGAAQLPALRAAMTRINRQLTAGFSDEELQTVARWLRHVQQLTEPDAGDTADAPR